MHVETVQMRGQNTGFCAELTKIVPNYHQELPLIENFDHLRVDLSLKRRGGGSGGGAMALGKLPVPGRPTIWMIVGQGPIALAIGAVEVFG